MPKNFYAEEVQNEQAPAERNFYAEELKTPKEPTVGFFGKVPISKYNQGERNIMGNLVDRPAAAVRSFIQGKGYVQGAVNPTKVPRFEELAKTKVEEAGLGFLNNPIMETSMPAANPLRLAGAAADIMTDPSQLLGMAAAPGIAKALNPAMKSIGARIGSVLPKSYSTPVIDKAIDTAFNKAIKPSTTGKGNFRQISDYSTRAREAVKSIYANKDNLVFEDINNPVGYANRLPESLHDFSSAIDQTKQGVFAQYDALAKQAGQQGVSVSLTDISKELKLLSKNKVLNDVRPEIAGYAKTQAKRFADRKVYTPEEAQQAVKIYNQSLDAFYKNPSPETASKAVIDSGIVNNLRKTLDDTITKAVGEQYQPLKNQYGALKAIEKDVSRRAVSDAGKSVKGLIDFSDILSGGQMARGILTLNPQEFVTGATQKLIANAYKRIINPNNIVKNMFQNLDKANRTAKFRVK